ncbi:MAG: hypothetical protein IT366_18970 [Candidatus Hydrogenedentes bacterium]|nr:hypothetical protein [Candidatus Hydrogenedentota bacterium]
MDLNNMNDLDRFIEDALKNDPLRPVPTGFHKRVEQRVRVAAIASSERRWFHSRMIASVILFAMVAFTVVIVPALAFFQGWTVRALPGAMGYLDYMMVFATQSWPEILLAVGFAAIVVVAAAVAWFVVPILRRNAARQH